MLNIVVEHLIHNVLPSAADYEAAEGALSKAYTVDCSPSTWEAEARLAKRRAAELAIATDGLTDRCAAALSLSKAKVRASVATYCSWRSGSIERVRGVANAYKHATPTDPSLPIVSDSDVLVVALGFGLDGFGVGKYGGEEVIVRDKMGQSWKFLGDTPAAISAWFKFLAAHGAALPAGPYNVCGIQVHP